MDRKQALRDRTRTSQQNREQKSTNSMLNFAHPIVKNDMGIEKVPMYKVKSGRDLNCLDILPFEISEEWYEKLKGFSGNPTGLTSGQIDYKLEVPVHYGIGPGNEVFLCLREAFGEHCDICEAMFDELNKDEPNKKISDALRPKWRTFYNVYDYDDPDAGIQIWDFSYHMFEKPMLEDIELDDSNLIFFWDLEDGSTIEFKGKEKKLGKNPFVECQSFDFLKRDPYDDNILDETYPLDCMLNIPTQEEVTKAFLQMENESNSAKSRSRGGRTRPGSSRGRGSDEESDDEESGRGRGRSESRGRGETNSRGRGRGRNEEDDSGRDNSRSRSRDRGRGREEEDIPRSVENPCPYEYDFGHECNTHPECDKCDDDIFQSCCDRKEEIDEEEKAESRDSGRGSSRGRGRASNDSDKGSRGRSSRSSSNEEANEKPSRTKTSGQRGRGEQSRGGGGRRRR